jgi:hypothetical protein
MSAIAINSGIRATLASLTTLQPLDDLVIDGDDLHFEMRVAGFRIASAEDDFDFAIIELIRVRCGYRRHRACLVPTPCLTFASL